MIVAPAELDRRELNGLINGLVAPRPIAWVSTVDPGGHRNLAPFSFFNAFCFHPAPVLAIGPGSRQGVNKDSLANIKATGEFVVNLVSAELAEVANQCSAEFGPDVDEWDVTGLQAAPCAEVAPPRVAASPASFECRVRQVVDLGLPELPTNSLVIGEVVRIHVADAAMDGLTPRPEVLDLVGRMGGDLWCTTRDRFTLARPSSADPGEVAAARPVVERA